MQNGGFSALNMPTPSAANSSASSLFSFQDPHKEHDFVSMYSSGSGFSPKPSHYTDPSNLYDFRLRMQNQQDMVNRHKLCLTRLREAIEELKILRQENSTLRSLNHKLNQHVSALIQASVQKQYFNDPDEAASLFHGLNVGIEKEKVCGDQEESPTSVMETGSSSSSGVDAERVSMPKSISVRSNGYLKTGQAAAAVGGVSKARTHQPTSQLPGKQKVYVRGAKKEEEPLELEVYNQGMHKTELCNKWQQTGACPYGDHCQFAHGIGELRPVIRHPRYKTEVCRMVLAGDNCPYGHRCHFRHALTDQERFMGHIRPRSSSTKQH